MNKGPKKGSVKAKLGQLHYAEMGAGEPLLLMGETPRSFRLFDRLQPLLAPQVRAIAVDLPGLGNSHPLPDMTMLLGVCDGWAPLGPPPLVPRDTAIPTLVLAGQFDPNARPVDSRCVAAMIGGHARWVELMGLGHSVRAFSPCVAGMVAAFINRPDQALDTSCAAQAPPIRYLPNRPAR